MSGYIARRLFICVPVLIGVTLFIFILIDCLPGDVVAAMMAPEAPTSQAALKAMRERLGLDRPWPVRYGEWLLRLTQGNLGYSYFELKPVNQLLKSYLGPTLELMGLSLAASFILGLLLGTLAAVRPYSFLDNILTVFGFAGRSLPDFFLALVLIYIFALRFKVLPVSGMQTPGIWSFSDHVQHLILPMMTLTLLRVVVFMRYTRASLLEELHCDYIRTARAKGLPERTIIWKHALRNGLIPIITILGVNIPILFTGAVVTETIFQWPGLGMLYVVSVRHRDYPVVMALSLLTAVAVLLSNLIVDIGYALIDPRVRYE